MAALLLSVAISCWAALQLQPGTFLPPISWPVISACIWLAHLQLRPRPDGADKRQAFAGLLSAAMLMVFLLQDEDFSGWGDVYFFCGSRMQYCTCTYRWNLAGWNKALVLWSFVLTTALGVQRLMVQVVLQGLLPGEEVVTRDSFICIGWRMIPYWLNNWEQQWGAECSSMMYELPQFAVELVIILPCVQILCARMKVLVMPSVNTALPRGWDGASAEQVAEAFVPNVQRGCWERRPEQKHLRDRLKANRHVTAFAALLCLLACFNTLFVPLHLENTVLTHPRAAAMQAVGRLPKSWSDAADLSSLSTQLQRGSLNLTHSFVTRQALKRLTHGQRAGLWLLGASDVNLAEPVPATAAGSGAANGPVAGNVARGRAGAFAVWMAAVERGPWQHNSTWAAHAVDELKSDLDVYKAEGCADVDRFRQTVVKHHKEIFRMQDPQHRLSVPLIEAALALMRLSTEKFFVLLSLYVSFLLFRIPPRSAATLVWVNARVSNALARLVLYSFPMVCWVYGAGVVFSTIVSVVFWGNPLWQVYHALRTHACTVTVKGLRPATPAEITRMHNDCAICWCPMTVAGAPQPHSGTASDAGSPASASPRPEGSHQTGSPGGGTPLVPPAEATTADAAEATTADAAATAAAHQLAAGPAGAGETADSGAGAVARQLLGLPDTDGSTLPCGHSFHQGCLTQWLQQCHAQGTSPTCPMCQARMQLAVRWHLWKALLSPSVWQLPTRRRGRFGDDGAAEGVAEGVAAGVGEQEPVAAVHEAAPHNNYLLRHNPRLAELLADMPQFLAPENVQLLADVQELRWRRDQLANELQLRQQQLQRLEGRHQELEVQLEVQRQQLINELQVLAQLQQQQAQQQAQQRAPDRQPQQPQQQPEQQQPEQQQPEQQQPEQQQHEAPQHLQHSQQVGGPQQEMHGGQHSSQCPQHEQHASLAGLQQSSDKQHPPLCRPEAAPPHGMAEASARPLHVQQQVVDQAPTLGNSSGTSHDRDSDRDGDAGGSSAAAGPSHQQHCAHTVHSAAEQAPLDGAAGSSSGGTSPSREHQAVPQAGPEQQQQQPGLGLRWRFRRRA